jgi:hypothetical protein
MRQFLQRLRTELFTFIVILPIKVWSQPLNGFADFGRLHRMHALKLALDSL